MKAKPGNRRLAGVDQWGLARFHFLVGLGWIRRVRSADCGMQAGSKHTSGRAMGEPRLGIDDPGDFALFGRVHKFERSDLV